ncbi:exonuclease domain-containing protein [Streptosporangium roseum]|uniref:exonuclease domain-containing protein n=1 Tax=Streptosporangium roseum TaxID=2001 RepID=UPI0004CD4D28|nr:exonuclease domain-containing protein [Streptosporangium roseum]
MTAPWYLGRLAAFDLETTASDPEKARIAEAYVGYVGGGLNPIDREPLLIDPGIEMPAEAAAIHGYTTEHLREHGIPSEQGVPIVAQAVAEAVLDGIPLVGQNIRYDLTVLHRECIRHDVETVEERAGQPISLVIDTLVLSKYLDRWRRRVSAEQGAHVLKTTAQVFGVSWVDEEAHGARYDALVAARVAWHMGRIAHMPLAQRPRVLSGRDDRRHLFDDLAVDLPTLFASQQRWAAEQAASYQEWLRSPKAGEKRDVNAVISGEWPIQSAPVLTP